MENKRREESQYSQPAKAAASSRFRLLSGAEDGLATRIAMVRSARSLVQAQYYIWDADTAGSLLALELLAAADRGVQVCVLIDEMTFEEPRASLAAINQHPKIQVKLFNPLLGRMGFWKSWLPDFARINRRMHNKLIVADGQLGLMGGRNVADHYFGFSEQYNFRDLDLLVEGPVVKDMQHSFECFWKSEYSVRPAELEDVSVTEADYREAADALHESATQARQRLSDLEILDPAEVDAERWLAELRAGMCEAECSLFFDQPESVEAGSQQALWQHLRRLLGGLEESLLIETAYIAPDELGKRLVRRLRKRDIHIRLLTNSLASIDEVAAYATLSRDRRKLLRAGVEYFELRSDAPASQIEARWPGAVPRSSLHCKVMVFDRRSVFLGSYNLDNRSAVINTEIGLIVHSETLADEVLQFMDRGVRPENAWQLKLSRLGRLSWIEGEEGGERRRWLHDPRTSRGRRLKAFLIRHLPIHHLT